MNKPTATLTSTNPSHEFTAQPGTPLRLATSGVKGTGTLKVQHRVVATDAWVDTPDISVAGHIAHAGVVVAVFNRVVVLTPDGTTSINLAM